MSRDLITAHTITEADTKLDAALSLHDFRVACWREAERHRTRCQRTISQLKGAITTLNRQIEEIECQLSAKQNELGAWHGITPGLSGTVQWQIPAPTVEATTNGRDLPSVPGIYFVWAHRLATECLYVGQSVRISKRATVGADGFRSDRKIARGEWISWLPVPLEQLDHAEAFYIGILRPVRNHRAQPATAAHSQAHSQRR